MIARGAGEIPAVLFDGSDELPNLHAPTNSNSRMRARKNGMAADPQWVMPGIEEQTLL
jgi:hypothetical protein